jgi:endonuclease G
VTGPAYQGTQLQSLKGRVLIPTNTWKAVYDPAAQGAAAYLCANARRPRCSTLSVSALTQLVGLDPFPALANNIKRIAIRLPPPESSPYASSRGSGHRRHSRPDWFLK